MKEEIGRLYQDTEFEVSELNACKIEKLLVCQSRETREPIIVYIKVRNRLMHQFFLDAGMGFWECREETWEDDGFDYVDLTEDLELINKTILKSYCQREVNNSRITIQLEDGRQLVLKCVDPAVFDSECELVLL